MTDTQAGREGAVERIATDIQKFWEPRMRKAIIVHLEAAGAGLDPQLRAVETLRQPAAAS